MALHTVRDLCSQEVLQVPTAQEILALQTVNGLSVPVNPGRIATVYNLWDGTTAHRPVSGQQPLSNHGTPRSAQDRAQPVVAVHHANFEPGKSRPASEAA